MRTRQSNVTNAEVYREFFYVYIFYSNNAFTDDVVYVCVGEKKSWESERKKWRKKLYTRERYRVDGRICK